MKYHEGSHKVRTYTLAQDHDTLVYVYGQIRKTLKNGRGCDD